MPPASDDAGSIRPAPECRACPLCAALATLRETCPEAVEHLAKAGAELLLAARALLDGATPDGPAPPRRGRARRGDAGGAASGNGLQRIDVG